jgi:hypothetical protein
MKIIVSAIAAVAAIDFFKRSEVGENTARLVIAVGLMETTVSIMLEVSIIEVLEA